MCVYGTEVLSEETILEIVNREFTAKGLSHVSSVTRKRSPWSDYDMVIVSDGIKPSMIGHVEYVSGLGEVFYLV